MKRLSRVAQAIVALLFLCGDARADLRMTQAGRISWTGESGEVQNFAVWNKGQKTRYDIQQLTILIDLEAKTRTTLDRSVKTVFVNSSEIPVPLPSPSLISITPTERRTRIAGHRARLYLWKLNRKDVDISAQVWCAEDVPRVKIPSLSGSGFQEVAQNKGMGGPPLRVRLVVRSGKLIETHTSEVWALSTKPIDDAVFAIPPEFQGTRKKR